VTLAAFQHDLGVCRNKTAQSGIDIHLFMEYIDQLQRIVGFSHDQVMSAFPAVTESRRIPPALKEKVAGFGTWRFAVGNQSQAVRQTICVFSCLGITKYSDGPLENVLKAGEGQVHKQCASSPSCPNCIKHVPQHLFRRARDPVAMLQLIKGLGDSRCDRIQIMVVL